MLMRNSTVLTTFVQEVTTLIDAGLVHCIEEIENHIEQKDVIDWLESEYPFNGPNGVDFSLFKQQERDLVHNGLKNWLAGYEGDENRKWGIKRNGLCLLVSWTIELIRDEFGRI
jgi:hypothetical protein